MQIHKNEIKTGILVLVTLGVLLTALVIVGMPGLIKPLNTYRIYFDNAQGIRPGAPVLLAGREIGKVTILSSPVPMEKRPQGHSDYEVCIEVKVAKKAEVYREVTVHLTQQGLMGQMVIDFVQGDPTSGLADDHAEFTGERIPDISEMASDNMERLTGPDSDLAGTLANAKMLTENLNRLTSPEEDLSLTIKKAKTFMDTLNKSDVPQVIKNTEQLTDTLKRQPWRLLWPSTKSYPEDKKDSPAAPKRK
jgi:ABC-type transporter Mla subunit MlaD